MKCYDGKPRKPPQTQILSPQCYHFQLLRFVPDSCVEKREFKHDKVSSFELTMQSFNKSQLFCTQNVMLSGYIWFVLIAAGFKVDSRHWTVGQRESGLLIDLKDNNFFFFFSKGALFIERTPQDLCHSFLSSTSNISCKCYSNWLTSDWVKAEWLSPQTLSNDNLDHRVKKKKEINRKKNNKTKKTFHTSASTISFCHSAEKKVLF